MNSKFQATMRSFLTEQDPEQSALPGQPPNSDNAAMPPDTANQDDIGEMNLLQVACRALLFDPQTITDQDKAKLAELAENGVTENNKNIALSLLNSYLETI